MRTSIMADDIDLAPETVDSDQSQDLQIVTFEIGNETFAVNMGSVLEIIRVPQTVPVPMTPPSLIGLANLRGGVLPVVDLRLLLNIKNIDIDEHTRVVVVDTNMQGNVGLVVDKVSQVRTVNCSKIDSSTTFESAHNDVIKAIIKLGDGQAIIQMLDINKALKGEFLEIAPRHKNLKISNNVKELAEDDELDNQLVTFSIYEQEYAFNLLTVEEIVRVPLQIATIPKSNSSIVGLIELRGKILPILCLTSILELPTKPSDDASRVIIVSLVNIEGQRIYAGFIVDGMKEVLRISDDKLEAMPELMKSPMDNQISNICQLDGGKRLVSLLCIENLFGHPMLLEATAEQLDEDSQMQTPEAHNSYEESNDDNTEQLVVFTLDQQEYAISIDSVQEITRLPESLDKVPKTQCFVEGLVNLRGTVLPVLDMRGRFNLTRMESNDRQRIVVISHKNNKTGYIVDAVLQVLRIPRENIEIAPSLSEDQTRIMNHIVNLKSEKRIIQIIDVNELLSADEINALDNEAA